MIKNVTISDGGIIFAGIGHKIESSTLTGTPPATGQAGIGTAMQVTGQNMAISGSKFSGFSNPISIADGADANMLGNSFEADIASANSINEYVKNLIKFEGAAGSYLDIAWIGKHISEADANYADRIAGKVDFICSNEIPACAGMTECAGTVEMLVLEITEKHDVVAYKQIAAELLTGDKAIGLKTKDDPADKPSKQIYPKQANAETGEITYAGDCHFDFKGINISLKQVIGFTFTNANKQTVQFLPPQALVSDMPDVIITAMPGATIPTTISGADGATVEDSTIFVTGYTAELPDTGAANADTASQDQKEPLIEWTNLGDGPKAKTDDATDSDGDGGQLSQRSGFTDGKVQASQGAGGACGANIAAAAPSAGGLVAQIILLFGSLPVVIERRRK
ncbi:MAG: hypothetical protein HYU98_01740 [Deltaproteobacteria bacterium]|nr:hypothetical protein [Deltaproteobacteria bacterium]